MRSEEIACMKLPPTLRQRAAALLDQQMWCWGCDVRRSAGNLLLAYGAEKRPAPESRLHSAYSFDLGGGAVITLWGWGIWIARQGCGSVFISRSKFRARYAAAAQLLPQAWREWDLPPTRADLTADELRTACGMLSIVFSWISAYETWLAMQVDPSYREQTIAVWPVRRRYGGGVLAAEMATSWLTLSEMLSRLTTCS